MAEDDLFDDEFETEFEEESAALGDTPDFATMTSAEFAAYLGDVQNPKDPDEVDISDQLAEWKALSGEDLGGLGKTALARLQGGATPGEVQWLDAMIQIERSKRKAEEAAEQSVRASLEPEQDELAEGIDFMALSSADWAKVMDTVATGRTPQRLDGAEFNRRLANAFGKEVV